MTKTKRLQPFFITGTIDKATGATPLDDLASAGFTVLVQGFHIISPGTAWNEATGIKIQDSADTPVVFATIVKAALAGSNAVVQPWTATHVTLGAGWYGGGTVSKKLQILPYGSTETTGTNLTYAIWGVRY